MFDLTGKGALVTGATGGIGGAIARALHAQGANVGISGTKAEKLDQRYNQVQQELTSASQRLKLVNGQAARYLKRFRSMRGEVARIAAQAGFWLSVR
jgi:NAD(P)-dependent dehydrogenase (short-subunit alcohol dehydrogenase family)